MLEETTRLTLAVSLMGVVLGSRRRFPLRGWRTLAVLLGLASSTLAYLILPILAALVVGAVITTRSPANRAPTTASPTPSSSCHPPPDEPHRGGMVALIRERA
jgi:hypothetical protein